MRHTGFARLAIACLLLHGAPGTASAELVEYELTIAVSEVSFTGKAVQALTVDGGIPGPTLRFTEGDVARIQVHNQLDVPSSVHWHGLLVPPEEDGVPGVSFPGIPARSSFSYEFPLRQSGTYWYHSHSGLQEQRGVYGSIVIQPREPDPVRADRDYVVVLSDWTDESPEWVMGLLKSGNEWYAVERGTNQSVLGALLGGGVSDFFRREWQSMPDNEISDVAYDRFLINGSGDTHFDASPGDTVRLRLINAGAASYFYVDFAGGPLTVVAADGLDVEPVQLDRLLVAIAETYDVLVTVPEGGAFELRATAQDGSGQVAARVGSGPVVSQPSVPQPDYYRNTMNAGYLRAAWNTAWKVRGGVELLPAEAAAEAGTAGAAGADTGHAPVAGMDHAGAGDVGHGGHGMQMSPPPPGRPRTPYAKLRARDDTQLPGSSPRRVVQLNLTGDMDRYVWSINGRIMRPSNTIRIRKGEVVRFELSNRTMMHHPMHLHGHFFRVLNGQGSHAPLKHTVDVAPMATTVIEFDANEEKDWFFHCHVLYHMKGGMERIVHYEDTEVDAATLAVREQLYKDHWYAFGELGGLSQMAEGAAQVSNTRNIFSVGWEVGYDDAEYDVTGAYGFYLNRYLTPFAGVNAYDDVDEGPDVRGVFGLSTLLPLNIRSSIWVGTDASFRWTAAKELQLARRLVGFAEVEYDSVTKWEWVAGGEVILTRHLSVLGQYSSEYGAGGGVRLRFYTPGF